MTCWPEGGPGLEPGTDMFGIAGTAELSTFCPGTGTWNRLQDGKQGPSFPAHGCAKWVALAWKCLVL